MTLTIGKCDPWAEGPKETCTLPGQDHNASAKAVAPALIAFFQA